MKVKEMIESLRKYQDSLYQEKAIQIKQLNYSQVTEIINLLQQGEAYRLKEGAEIARKETDHEYPEGEE